MKTLLDYIHDEIMSVAIRNDAIIHEAIKIGASADSISVYSCQPKDVKELRDIIKDRIDQEGHNCDLNDIDISKITDMSNLFNGFYFNCDISRWNTSNVKNMKGMFMNSEFNGDISKWNVSNVENMNCMFAYSDFNGDISDWDVSNVEDMDFMFSDSKFNQDISNWKINDECDTRLMFIRCPTREEYKPKSSQKK